MTIAVPEEEEEEEEAKEEEEESEEPYDAFYFTCSKEKMLFKLNPTTMKVRRLTDTRYNELKGMLPIQVGQDLFALRVTGKNTDWRQY